MRTLKTALLSLTALFLTSISVPLSAETQLPQCSCADKIQIFTPDGQTWIIGPVDEEPGEPDPGPGPTPEPDPGASAGAKFIAETAKFRDKDTGRPIALYHEARFNGTSMTPESIGLVELDTIYERAFLPRSSGRQGSSDGEMPAPGVVERIVRGAPDIFAGDIESFWPAPGNGTAPLKASAIQAYLGIGQRIIATKGDKVWGWYSTVPQRSYFAPVRGGSLLAAWQRSNDLLKPIAAQVDILFPSIYTFSSLRDRGDWAAYARGQISEALRLAPSKPVIVYLWPFYHAGGTEPIEADFIRFQMETVIDAGASGFVMWQTSQNNRLPYSQATFPWVEEIKDFMQDELVKIR